jgi:tyrosyl-tRNA synthetase
MLVNTSSLDEKRTKVNRSELEQKRYHSPKEFATYVGVSLSSVSIHLGTLIPYFKLGGRVLIDKDKAIAALEAATGRKG